MGVKVRWHHNQYYIFINHKGKREAHKAGENEQKALKVARELEQALLRGELGLKKKAGASPTLTAHFATWLSTDGAAGRRCKRGALGTYKQTADCYILPVMGDKLVADITRAHCIDLIEYWKAKGNRSKTLQLITRTLSTALTDAADHLPVNPAFKLKSYFRCPDEIKHNVKFYTREESDKFLASARLGPHEFFRLFLIALRSGLRHGELIGLQWGDLDFHTKLINVERTLDQDGLHPTAPKHGQRFVDMSDEVIEHLKPLKRKHGHDEPICPTAAGTPYDQRTMLKRLHSAMYRAKVRRLGMHELRHTFASQVLQDGAPLNYVKEQCGHSSITITVDLYGHLVPSANRQWVNRLTAAAPQGATA